MQKLNGFPIERKKLTELTKAPYNPRKISEEQAKALQKSLETFGVVEPIIWNKQTGHIVGGHQRLDALLQLGETGTDVLIVDLPEEREQALNIALNRKCYGMELDPHYCDVIIKRWEDFTGKKAVKVE